MHKINNKVLLGILIMIFFNGATLMAGNPLLPHVTPEMTTADYWIAKTGQTGIQSINMAQITELNVQTARNLPDILVDLAGIGLQIPPNEILGWIQIPAFPKEPQFYQGKPLPDGFWEKIRLSMNLAGVTGMTIGGVTLRRADIRTFPTDYAIFSSPDDREFDNLQETAVNPGDAVVILHQSANRQWSYIQTSNYRGWMATANIGITSSQAEWLAFQNPSDFIVVTGPSLMIKDSKQPEAPELFYEMGARIPLVAPPLPNSKTYTVILPDQKPDGTLAIRTVDIPVSEGLHHGYLPFTQTGLIRQAFKMLGKRYGWGGMFQGVDCSSFTMDIYRCFGIVQPRNSGEQARSGLNNVDFSQADLTVRRQILSRLPAGSLLFLKGHVMLYLGEVDGRYYAIHALSAYGQPIGTNQYQRTNVMQVTVSDLELTRTNGNTLLQSIVSAKTF